MRPVLFICLLALIPTGTTAGAQTTPPDTAVTDIGDVTVTAPGSSLNISARMEF